MPPDRPRLLVTGFGPFPGMARNPSAEIARRVASSPRLRRLRIAARSLILPTTYAALDEELEPAVQTFGPHAVLMVGVAGRSKKVRIERRAVNRVSVLLPDALGRRPNAPTFTSRLMARSVLPNPARWRAILRRHGIPSRISQDAGRYLCNAAYYRALAAPVPVLFIHIPKPPSARRRSSVNGASRSSWNERLAAALVDVVVQLLTVPGGQRPLAVAASPPVH